MLLKTKQEEVMTKLAEIEEITRHLQRTLGLTDFSSITFSKMFDMLPYPHSKVSRIVEDQDKTPKPEDLFDLPQIDYPEDK